MAERAYQVNVSLPKEYLARGETTAHLSKRMHDILMYSVVTVGTTFHLLAREHQENRATVPCMVMKVNPGHAPAVIVPTTFVLVEEQATEQKLAARKTYSDFGAGDKAVEALVKLLTMPKTYHLVLKSLAVGLPTGVLLCGPPGVGKTRAVTEAVKHCNRLAAGHQYKLFLVDGSEIFHANKMDGSGGAEMKIRSIFQAAEAFASQGDTIICHAVIFIDEIDVLCPHRGENSVSSTRIVAQFLTLMDGMKHKSNLKESTEQQGQVFVIGATNRPNDIDEALRRPGRFDREIVFPPLTLVEKVAILTSQCAGMEVSDALDYNVVAEQCVGYSGADIVALCRDAGLAAVSESAEVLALEHFQRAMVGISPSATRGEFFHSIGGLSWDEIGGLKEVKNQVRRVIEWPLVHAPALKRMGIRPPRGLILYGPPGCAKTTIARTAAAVSKASFLTLSGGDMYSAFVGESERVIRTTFHQARQALPAIIFLDEIDAIVGKRNFGGTGSGGGESDGAQSRILSTLLNEMDGIASGANLLVIAATNRIDMVDPALLRPGRFDKHVYIPLPDNAERGKIMEALLKKSKVVTEESAKLIAHAQSEACAGMSGADLKHVVQKVAMEQIAKRASELRLAADYSTLTNSSS